MEISIRAVNNGYIVFNEHSFNPGMLRIPEDTHIATDIEDLCEVIKKIYTNEQNKKSKPESMK
jgi:hypothetical protein